MADKHPTKNNLYFTHPAIAKEWHQFKNGSLRPTDITLIANRKVWWLCSKDHVWAAAINERIKGNTCPYCAESKVTEEKSTQKIIASPSKQYLSPKDESPRFKDKTEVSKKKVSPENCLQTVNPNLAKEWHPTRNGSLTPKDVTVFYNNQVWWRCANGHEWKAAVAARNSGQGCFYCNYIHRSKG